MKTDELYISKLLDYAKKYEAYGDCSELKTIHMLSVTRVINLLAKAHGLDEHMKLLAYITGLFHDLGRFEQIKQYGTFRDEQSFDHADFSEKIMFEDGFVKELPERDQKMIGDAIRNHNKLYIEDGLDSDTLLLAKLIRDADKTDIYRVVKAFGFQASFQSSKTELENSEISDECRDSILEHKLINIKYRKYPLDYVLSCMALIFDFNFKEPLKIIQKDRVYLCGLETLNIKNAASKSLLEKLINEADSFVNDNVEKLINNN